MNQEKQSCLAVYAKIQSIKLSNQIVSYFAYLFFVMSSNPNDDAAKKESQHEKCEVQNHGHRNSKSHGFCLIQIR